MTLEPDFRGCSNKTERPVKSNKIQIGSYFSPLRFMSRFFVLLINPHILTSAANLVLSVFQVQKV